MSISKCIVRLKDCHNTEHSVEVYAEPLYEAVLPGLNRLQDVGWESNGKETIQRVEVEIHQEPTRHIVDVPKLLKWIEEKICVSGARNQESKVAEITRQAIEPARNSSLYGGSHPTAIERLRILISGSENQKQPSSQKTEIEL